MDDSVDPICAAFASADPFCICLLTFDLSLPVAGRTICGLARLSAEGNRSSARTMASLVFTILPVTPEGRCVGLLDDKVSPSVARRTVGSAALLGGDCDLRSLRISAG
jgi:hypothetical protein